MFRQSVCVLFSVVLRIFCSSAHSTVRARPGMGTATNTQDPAEPPTASRRVWRCLEMTCLLTLGSLLGGIFWPYPRVVNTTAFLVRPPPQGSDRTANQRTAARTRDINASGARSASVHIPGPVAWVHIPKCGTSLCTALIHYANDSLPERALCPAPASQLDGIYPVDKWFRDVFWLKGDRSKHNIGNHFPISDAVWQRYQGRCATRPHLLLHP